MRPRFTAVAAALVAAALAAPALATGAPTQRTWHAEQIHAPVAHERGADGNGVLVAVLDTWVDGAHPDFAGRVLVGADCTSGTCVTGEMTQDSCDHGTHVAGIVASSSFGVAPRALVLPVQVLAYDAAADPPACNGTVAGVANGIRYAVARGARVINLSLGALVPGLSSSTQIADALEEAVRNDVVVVFAAGNANSPVSDDYGDRSLIVGATGPDGHVAPYSQRGPGVSLLAPGGAPGPDGACTPGLCVTSLFPDERYAVAAGTSMAAPHVAGAAAVLLAADPDRTRDDVVTVLRQTAHPIAGADHGLVDLAAALGHDQPPPRPSEPVTSSDDAEPQVVSAPPVPVDPEPLPSSPVVAARPAGELPAPESLPAGLTAVATALVVAAGLSTALAAGSRPR